ncbi:unnamed protein product [Aphis gossypii]|uniref:Uncharacterized protein n=1 Tax=Aphis gossypii TaxID=80765 RepID=A0A9P0IW70_APHGO|nr:unnamed protein product [Aphis gossypii]
MKMYKIFYETLRSNNCPVVGHLAYRIDTKTRHVRRKMASAFFLSPKISAFHDTRRCRIHVNRLIVYPTSLDRTRCRLQFLIEKSPANKTIAHTLAENSCLRIKITRQIYKFLMDTILLMLLMYHHWTCYYFVCHTTCREI